MSTIFYMTSREKCLRCFIFDSTPQFVSMCQWYESTLFFFNSSSKQRIHLQKQIVQSLVRDVKIWYSPDRQFLWFSANQHLNEVAVPPDLIFSRWTILPEKTWKDKSTERWMFQLKLQRKLRNAFSGCFKSFKLYQFCLSNGSWNKSNTDITQLYARMYCSKKVRFLPERTLSPLNYNF